MGPMRGNGPGKLRETVKVVGSSSSAGDDGSVVPTHIHKNVIALGGMFVATETVTLAGTTVVLTAIAALGSNTVYCDLEGDY